MRRGPGLLLAVLLSTGGITGCRKACVKGDVETCQVRCEAGEALACRYLSEMYTEGISASKDLDRAGEIARKACVLKDGRSCSVLAGEAYDRNAAKEGDDLFRQGCEADDADGCGMLGMIYMMKESNQRGPGSDGVEPSYIKAAELLRKACKLGEKTACPEALATKVCDGNQPDMCEDLRATFPDAKMPPVPGVEGAFGTWLAPLLLELAARATGVETLFQGASAHPLRAYDRAWLEPVHKTVTKVCVLKDKLSKPPSAVTPEDAHGLAKAAAAAKVVCAIEATLTKYDRYAANYDTGHEDEIRVEAASMATKAHAAAEAARAVLAIVQKK